MTQRYADRVAESTTTTGTGTITLGGALPGFRAFSGIPSIVTNDTVYYSLWAVDSNGNANGVWETGLGTYNSTGPTLARTTVLDGSSGAGVNVTLPTGTSYVTLSVIATQTPQIGPDNGVVLPLGTSQTTPAANTSQIYTKQIAQRGTLAIIDQNGDSSSLQPYLARNKIAYWNPPGNGTSAPGIFGLNASGIGTATTRNVATTNLATRMRRIGYPTTSTAGTFGGLKTPAAQWSCGSGTGGDGSGFKLICRWVEADASPVSGRREFIGVLGNSSTLTNNEPNTITNAVGIIQISTDATQYYWYAGGSTAAFVDTAIGTAIGAPAGNSTTAWELAINCPSATQGTYYLQLTNLVTGVTASTTISSTSAVQVPQSSTLLAIQMWLTNNATAAVAGIDVASMYIETDN